MTPMPPFFAATLFLALASLLRWTYRRDVTNRLQRSLKVYLIKRHSQLGLSNGPRLEAA